jgi:hypothetical protein
MKKSEVVRKCIKDSCRRTEPDVVYLPWYKTLYNCHKGSITDSKDEALKARKAHNDKVLAEKKAQDEAKRNQK